MSPPFRAFSRACAKVQCQSPDLNATITFHFRLTGRRLGTEWSVLDRFVTKRRPVSRKWNVMVAFRSGL